MDQPLAALDKAKFVLWSDSGEDDLLVMHEDAVDLVRLQVLQLVPCDEARLGRLAEDGALLRVLCWLGALLLHAQLVYAMRTLAT